MRASVAVAPTEYAPRDKHSAVGDSSAVRTSTTPALVCILSINLVFGGF